MNGISDADQTKLLRQIRVNEKKAVKELNQIGKRITWIREKLGMSQREVCLGTGIPASSLCGREAGVRAELVEEYLIMSMFFNRAWAVKFKLDGPIFNGKEVKKISVEWLIYGHSDLEANAEAIILEYKIQLKEMEEKFFYHEAELKKQLQMFVDEVV